MERVKETMRNQLRIKALGKIQDPLALAASQLLMLPVSTGNFVPHHHLVQLIDTHSTALHYQKQREGK